MKIKQLFHATWQAEAVYELRKTPIFVTVLIAIFLGILQMTPFTISFFEIGTYRFDLQMWDIEDEQQGQLLQSLPEACYISDFTFICDERESFTIGEDISIHFNDPNADLIHGIVFFEQHFVFVANQQDYVLSYGVLDGLHFGELQSLDHGYDILFGRVAEQLRGILIVPFVLGVYQTGILTFFIYILGISAFSMLLKFGHTRFISFKEMLNIMVFAAMLPILIVIAVGLITPAFSTIIFNMGTPLWAYVVYKKYVIPGLQSSSKVELEKKECE